MTVPTLILPVTCSALFRKVSGRGVGWMQLFSWSLLQPIQAAHCKFDSGGFLQNSIEAVLDRLASLGRDFLNETPEFLILRGRDLEVLAALRGRQLHDFRQRL